MSTCGRWKTTNLGPETPRLLMKTRFDKHGYRVQLTDLGRVWEEVADRDAIVVRARNSECSFDPGADEDNYDALLRYIQNALDGQPKTSISIQFGSSESLELQITASLPGDLPLLKWNFYLTRLPESAVAIELVNPLFLQVNNLQSQVQQLIDEISTKDHVIQKITDKYETGGNDLTAVFPGASNVKTSRKRSQRSQLAGHVKGLADFDEAAWRASVANLSEEGELSADKLDELLNDLSPSDTTKPPDDWWEKMTTNTESRNGAKGHEGSARVERIGGKRTLSHNSNLRTQESMQDDEFERQETPPRNGDRPAGSKSQETEKPMPTSNTLDDGDETEDDDDLDMPSNRTGAHIQDRLRQHEKFTVPSIEKEDPPAKTASPRKLGKIGGKKASTPQPKEQNAAESHSPSSALGQNKPAVPSPTRPKSKLGAFGGKAASRRATPDTAPSQTATVGSKPKLGTFGGKAKKASPALEHETNANAESSKIGRFGGRSATRTASPAKVKEEAPVEEAVEEEEKTEEQRANENREKLKRELEEKAKQPVKKKRKF